MFEHNSNEYKGAMSPLSSALDGSAQKTVVLIERSIATLESYLAPAAPKLEESPNDQQITSIARKGEEKMEPTQDEHADSNSPTD